LVVLVLIVNSKRSTLKQVGSLTASERNVTHKH